jgi:hypothetical protein
MQFAEDDGPPRQVVDIWPEGDWAVMGWPWAQ